MRRRLIPALGVLTLTLACCQGETSGSRASDPPQASPAVEESSPAPAGPFSSDYTHFDLSACTVTQQWEEGASASYRCPGRDGVPLLVGQGDGRFTLEGLCVDGGDRLVAAAGSFGLKAALPNPSSGVAELRFETIENGPTSLTVYDDRGGEVAWLLRGVELPVGEHRVLWSRGDLPSGSYEVLLAAPSGRSRLRLIVVR